jgi:parallel beta-helix repeat protein
MKSVAALVLVSTPLRASATTYYVDNSTAACSNSGPGTTTRPYCTISAALAAHHVAGTTIVVMPGIYREQVTVPASGSPSSPIVLQGQGSPGSPVVVDGADDFADPALWIPFSGNVWRAASVTWSPAQVFADSARLASSTAAPASLPANSFAWVAGQGLYVNAGGGNPGNHIAEVSHRPYGIYVTGRSWVVVDGFTATRSEQAGIKLANLSNNITVTHNTATFSSVYGIQADTCTTVLIGSNIASDNLWSGIALTAGSTGCTVQDNESFHNLTPNQSSGIYGFGSPANLIQRNRLHHNAYNGIFLTTGAVNNVLIQNQAWKNSHQGIEDIFCPGNTHVGDVSYNNAWNGFAIEGGATGTTLRNCVAINNGQPLGTGDLEVDAASTSGFTSNDNLFWHSTHRPVVVYAGVSYTSVATFSAATGKDTRTLQADPRFSNPAGGDFRPTAGSPLIDAADSGAPNWPATDAAGNSRADDPATPNTGRGTIKYADRGAYEFQPNDPPPPPVSTPGTYYVNNASGFCSDAGSGTLASPYCTITGALDAHNSPGTTIVVLPGLYREQVEVPASGEAGNPIVLQAQGSPGNPVVVSGADDFSNPALWVPYSGNVWLAASVTWSPKQVFADNARLTPATGAPGSLAPYSFVWVAGAGLYVNAGGGNPGSHLAEVGERSFGIWVPGTAWAVIDGFTTTRTEFAGIEVDNVSSNVTVTHNVATSSYTYGIQADSSTAVRIGSNVASDNLWSGIALTNSATGCTVEDNESFNNLTPNQSCGFYDFGAPGNLIQRNRLHDNAYNGVMLSGGAINNVLRQNRSWANEHQGFEDIFSSGNSHVGDVSHGNGSNGFAIEGGATGTTLYDCVATENGEIDLEVDPSSTAGFTSNDNLFWNSSTRTVVTFGAANYLTVSAYGAATGQDTRTLQADPRFTSAGTGDFRPVPGSPLIDAANSGVANWSATDAAGNVRLDDPATVNTGLGPVAYADRGALEYLPPNQPPVAKLVLTPASGQAPLAVSADASGSLDPEGGRLASYRFDFGDGTLVGPQPGATATHTYTGVGRWVASVVVTDSLASSGTATAADTVRAGPASVLAFVQQPSAIVAGAAMTPGVSVRVRDAFGNAVPGAPVALSLVGGGTLGGNTAAASDSTGLVTFAGLSVDLVGAKHLSASSGALAPVASDPFAVSAAAASVLTFAQQPSAVVAGVTIAPAVTVRVRDAFGNSVAGVPVALGLVESGTLTGGAAVASDADGLSTFAGLGVDLAGSKHLSASSGALTPVSSDPFAVSAAPASVLTFVQQPSAVVAGATMSPAATVRVRDAFGNAVPGAMVALGLVESGTLTGGAAVASDTTGLTTFGGLTVDLAGAKHLSASSGALTPVSSDPFTVSAAAASAIAFVQQPSAVVAGATMTPAVTVRVRDAFGNAVSGATVSLTLVESGTLTGGAAVTSDTTGLTTFGGLTVDLAGAKHLSASSGALAPVASDPFTVSAAAASMIAFVQQPSAVMAGATMTPAVTVRVRDAFGNAVSGAAVALTLVESGTLTGGAAVASDTTGLTTFGGLTVDLAGAKHLSASSGALTLVASDPFTVSAAAASVLTFVQQPSAVVAGATMTPAVTVRVRDAFGNAVAGAPVALGLVESGTLTGGTAVASDTTGLTTFGGLTVDLAGAKHLSASSGALAPVASDPFAVSAAAASVLTFVRQPGGVVAGATMTPAVTVRVRDAFGNAVPGATVALTLVESGTLTGGAAVASDSTGLTTFAALSVDLVGSKQLSASSGALAPVASNAFAVSPAAASVIAFIQQPSSVTAGAAMTPVVTVRVRDAFGNAVPGATVALSLVGSGTLTAGAAVASDSTGLTTFAALSVDLVGSKQLSASTGALAPVASNAFAVSAAAPSLLTFVQQPGGVVAGATITPAVTVRVRDAFGNAVPGTSVALSLVGSGTLTAGAAVASDSTGLTTFAALSVDLVGSKQLNATCGALAPVASNAFTVSAAAPSLLTFVQQPGAVVAGATITPAVIMRVRDAFGNAVPGVTVALSLVGSGTLTAGPAVASDSTGLTTFAALSVDLVGSKQLSASSGTLAPVASIAFTVSPAAASAIAFVQQPSGVVAGAAITPAVTVRVRDAFGNAVPGAMVALSLVGSGTLTAGPAVASDSTGLTTFAALSVDVAGAKHLSASSGALAPVASDAFTVSAGAASVFAFEQQPSPVVAGATMVPAVKVRVRDAFGNAVAGAPVTLGLVESGTLSGGAVVASDTDGLATFGGVRIEQSGLKHLRAASGTGTPVASDPFRVSAGAPVALVYVQQPSASVAGVPITPVVSVQLRDALGNGVPGGTVELSLVGTGSLRGSATAVGDSTGLSTFPGLNVDLVGTKQLIASLSAPPDLESGGGKRTQTLATLAPVTSNAFTVSAGPAVALVFEQQPSSTVIGAAITPSVVVRVRDAFNNNISGAVVSLSLGGGGTLGGATPAATDSGGRATFPALRVNLPGVNVLRASSGALAPVLSNTFTVNLSLSVRLTPVITLADSLGGPGSASAVAASARADSAGGTAFARMGGFAPRLTPNPMRSAASLGFALERPGTVQIRVFDLGGRLVRTLPILNQASAGWTVVAVDGRADDGAPLRAGVYLYEVRAGDQRAVGRFVVIR